jgi:hypothetical protein
MKAKKLPLLPTLFVATVCAIGFATVFIGLGEGLLSVLQAPFHPQVYFGEQQGIAFTKEGDAVLQVNVSIDDTAYNFRREYRRLDGSPLEKEVEDQDILSGCYLYLDRYSEEKRLYQPGWENRLVALWDYQDNPAYWYLVHDGEIHGRAYFAGFDVLTRARVGYIGAKGYSDSLPPREDWFDITLNQARNLTNQVESHQGTYYRTQFPQITEIANDKFANGFRRSLAYIQDDRRVYEVDLKNRESKVLFDSPDESIYRVGFLYTRDPADEDDLVLSLAIRTETRVLFFGPEGNLEETLVLPEKFREEKRLTVYRTVDDRFFLDEVGYCVNCGGEAFPADAKLKEVTATYVASSGEILSEQVYHFDPKNEWRAQPLTGTFILLNWGPGFSAFMMLVFAPAVEILSGRGSYGEFLGEAIGSYFEMLDNPQTWYLTVVFLLAQVLAFYLAHRCWLRENRYHSPTWERRMWTGLVLFFGLPGWVGYMAHRHWPVLESCPSCEESYPVDSEGCPACGSRPATPAIQGSEIFAS